MNVMIDYAGLLRKAYKYHCDGDFATAEESYLEILKKIPEQVDTLYLLGSLYLQKGNIGSAYKFLKNTVTLKPDHAEAHNNLGSVLQEQGRLDDAIASYQRAIGLKPDYAGAYYNIADAFKGKGRTEDAMSCYKKSISLDPNYAEAYNNYGVMLKEQGKLEEALSCYKKALELRTAYADAHSNLANVLHIKGELAEAVAGYDRAIEIMPNHIDAHFNRSLVLLLTEKFKEGWVDYEWRLRMKGHNTRDFELPMWDGPQIKGKNILVYAEQGFGDTIQFVRYLPMVKKLGGYVVFECHKELLRLLNNCEGFDEIKDRNSYSEIVFDVQAPLLSLPRIFNTTLNTIPASGPYIKPDLTYSSKWREKFNENNNYKIGIVWAGSPTFRNDRYRSCSLSDFAPLASIKGITFYSLQKGPASLEISNSPDGMKIIDLQNELNDFADTAAIIDNLDLIISVDTAMAHLAGAIGKTVWVLLPVSPDWRWFLNTNDSPWYPSMRLFRQTLLNDWKGVFKQMRNELLDKLVY